MTTIANNLLALNQDKIDFAANLTAKGVAAAHGESMDDLIAKILTMEGVDTSSGDAIAADLLLAKKAWVDGAEITGTKSPLSFIRQYAMNSFFGNGIAGFTTTTASLSVASNVLSITGSGAGTNARALQDTGVKPTLNHILYLKAKIRVTNNICVQMTAILRDGSAGTVALQCTQATPTNGQWYTLSGIVVIPALTNNLFILLTHSYSSNADASGKICEVEYFIVLDLTNLYGAGNEPSAATMNGYEIQIAG